MEHSKSQIDTVGLKVFNSITDAWSQPIDSQTKLLALRDTSEFEKLIAEESPELTKDMVERISFLMKIHRSLHAIFANSTQANSWVDRKNSRLGDLTAVEYMHQNGKRGMEEVCEYLLSQC